MFFFGVCVCVFQYACLLIGMFASSLCLLHVSLEEVDALIPRINEIALQLHEPKCAQMGASTAGGIAASLRMSFV